MKASKAKARKAAPKPAKPTVPVKPKAAARPASATPRVQDTRELRTLRTPWGLCDWLGQAAAEAKTSKTAIIMDGLRVFIDKTRLKPKPISEERAALMRKVAKLARLKFFPGVKLLSDAEALSATAAKALLADPVARELYDIACEEMSRPTDQDLVGM
jgi:hypothetical protein